MTIEHFEIIPIEGEAGHPVRAQTADDVLHGLSLAILDGRVVRHTLGAGEHDITPATVGRKYRMRVTDGGEGVLTILAQNAECTTIYLPGSFWAMICDDRIGPDGNRTLHGIVRHVETSGWLDAFIDLT